MSKKNELKAAFGSPDRPLIIGNFEIPCYVLSDGKRVISQSGMLKALGMSHGTAGKDGADRLTKFISQDRFNTLIPNDILALITSPIKFNAPIGGGIAYGYEATILVDICDAVIQAKKQKKLQKQQEHIAENAEILIRGFAKTGIIALIDEATGYQEIREKDALKNFLEKFLLDEKGKWIKTFQDDFFEMIFKMKGWTWYYASTKKPSVVGHYINDFVYSRIGPQVLKELKERNIDPITGKKKAKHHQFLSTDYGHPKLREHLASLVALGRASGYNWNNFKRMVERAFPKFGDTLSLDFPEDTIPVE